jgi:glucose/mannose-6-phosphate isomerase
MNLDDAGALRAADRGKVLASIEGTRRQCALALDAARGVVLPGELRDSRGIVVAGMGGSALAADIARALLRRDLRVPLEVVRGETLPAWVGPQTLVVLCSYSGGTEETLGAAAAAVERTRRVVALTTGGALARRAAEWTLPLLSIDPATNPSGQPRFAVGGALCALLGLLERVGAIDLASAEAAGGAGGIERAIAAIDRAHDRYGADVGRIANVAKESAIHLEGRAALVVASGHLAGNARALANQVNETAKSFAVPFEIPELNHHLMEGLLFPASNRGALLFLFLESRGYGPRIAARYAATREVVARQGIAERTVVPQGDSPLEEALDALLFGSYLAYYLALRNGQDPAAIPWVDHFKERLATLSGTGPEL